MFTLPAELPALASELDALRSQARASINVIQARHTAGEELSRDDVADLKRLLGDVKALDDAHTVASAAEKEHLDEVNALLTQAEGATVVAAALDAPAVEGEIVEGEIVAEAEAIVEDAVAVTAGADPVKFAGAGTVETPPAETGPGWEMVPGAPGYRTGKIGFAEMGVAIDNVRGATKRVRPNRSDVRNMAARAIAQLNREMNVVGDSHELVAAINAATDQRNLPGGSLVAAGGWCAPSEQLYDFCDVPEATDLLSLPEIAINRGGIRWPVEPDVSAIADSFEFFFTEPQLEAVDGNGDPTAFKHCVEVPCPDEFEELRLNAVGYCVTAGILQRQGWPEVIEWFLRWITQEHFRALSRRSILDMVHGSGTPISFAANLQVGGTSSVLNSLALMATNIRLNRGYGRQTIIEGVAPSWFFEVLRADMAMMEGIETKAVGDAQIQGWLGARNIALQFVGDWQTRDTGQPGNLSTVRWPGHVNILLYPAGTWFRSLSNIIEVGVLYPKDELQINRYTEFFTEDAIAIGKRCGVSLNVQIPLPVSGGYGAPVTVTYSDTTSDTGAVISGAPIASGQEGNPKNQTLGYTGTLATGTFKLTYDGEETAALPALATAAQVKTALVNLNDGYSADDFITSGGPLGTAPIVITHPGGVITVTSSALTGGSSPVVNISAPVDVP